MVDDFFHNRLDQMSDLRNPLAVIANRIDLYWYFRTKRI